MTNPSTTPKIEDRIAQLDKHLRRICNQMSIDSMDADDIYSYVIELMLAQSNPADSNSKLLTFARWKAIAYRALQNTYNKNVAEEAEISTGTDEDDTVELTWETFRCEQQSVEDQVVEKEELAAIRNIVDTMSPENQKIVKMIARGDSPAEISRIMNVSRSAISQRIAAMTSAFAGMNLLTA
jgi:RNA polymerase sigma factor (sigma-70 family)